MLLLENGDNCGENDYNDNGNDGGQRQLWLRLFIRKLQFQQFLKPLVFIQKIKLQFFGSLKHVKIN